MKKLQVYRDQQWQFVFCHNKAFNTVVTTDDKPKALPQKSGWKAHDLRYFERSFPCQQFRIEP